ncbi:hypothetical protein CERSUDRAFT_83469 [Gelatoporia subvermispora B]|uniref:Essential protein Yae1 N-terminal domain-containing protein n=1 Tax=Ceriporiopsis subvermispora (strain B) TaxID=914234 RepID=M2RGX9_CERS8|nr:hypothetical protein CERSUDRAFT_83469 [Gelatoporia subvermispora B]
MVSPSPLEQLARDPALLSGIVSHRKTRRGSTGSRTPQREHSRDRGRSGKEVRREKKDSEAASLLTVMFAEEERQTHHLKAVLRSTSERLDYEARRADQAELRARTAETQAHESSTRASNAESARHAAELDTARAREEVKRYQLLIEAAERETRRLQAELQRQERLRAEAEQSATEVRETARVAQQALREYQARDSGRAERRRAEVQKNYNDGREDGFEDGRATGYEAGYDEGFQAGKDEGFQSGHREGFDTGMLTGFEEGKKAGWSEGFAEGKDQGQREERERALEAFDRFVETELDRRSMMTVVSHDRTEKWLECYAPSREASPSPKPVPPPSLPTEPSPVPVPVWLHRRLHYPAEAPSALVATANA